MRKLYGDSLRKDAGFVKVIKKVASKNARLLELRAEKLGMGRHAPEITRVVRVVKEVRGTFEKVFEETAEVVEEFLAKCEWDFVMSLWCEREGLRREVLMERDRGGYVARSRIPEVMQDTKFLLQQSREKLVITYVHPFLLFTCLTYRTRCDSRVANDLSSYETDKYRATILPNATGALKFHLGEPIRVKWQAPANHSRKDWIGIYRVCALSPDPSIPDPRF